MRSDGPAITKSISLSTIFILLMSILGLTQIVMPNPIEEAIAQPVDEIPFSFEWAFSHTYPACNACVTMETATTTQSYLATASLKPVPGGYDGTGSGLWTHSYVHECDEGYQFTQTITGQAEMTVTYRYSFGGNERYNSSYAEVYVGISGQNLHIVENHSGCSEDSSIDDYYGSTGYSCTFYELNFEDGQTYASSAPTNEGWPDAKCFATFGEINDDLHIFGSVKGLFGSKGEKGLSDSRVLLGNLDEGHLEKLSTSRPSFIMKTATSDNETAKYEFKFAKEPGSLPKVMVVSLLWYEGKPEFAITNGNEADGRLIPVYQAICVDDDPQSECEKWERTSDGGYEAEVNFEYGNVDKILKSLKFLDAEDWAGSSTFQSQPSNQNNSGVVAISEGDSAVVMADSAYMYYESHRAMKYFETLGLQSTLKPLAIRSHDFAPDCVNGTAWYDGKFITPNFKRSFGDLGTYADRVEVDDEVVMCDARSFSSLNYYGAPDLQMWHEIGHYLQFQMYDAEGIPHGMSHAGYVNPSTNDSVIEGFAGFVAMLIHEYYGLPDPQVYNSVDVELDTKIWGPYDAEEEAVAGILWDFHDKGIEINRGHFMNATVSSSGSYVGGTLTLVSRVYPQSSDAISHSAPVIMQVIERNQVKTLVDLYSAFVSEGLIGSTDMDMIYVNHGVFADVEDRNFVHDSANEKIGESGSKSSPVRLVRSTPPEELPGSYIVTDADSTFNFTIRLDSPYDGYSYSYLREMKAGERMYFRMPPEYYPSTLTVTAVSTDAEPMKELAEIYSGDYWTYINSSPPKDGIFKRLSVTVGPGSDDTSTAVQYIRNVKDLLSRVSTEYRAGNTTGAEKLATIAYIDNFEHVESELEDRNATELKEQTEDMLRVELLGLIRDRAAPQSIDDKIAEINLKLEEAIVIVPEFPVAAIGVIAAVVGVITILGRLTTHTAKARGLFR